MSPHSNPDPVTAFIVAASTTPGRDHSSGDVGRAEALRADHPGVASTSIHAAAILGDEASVRAHIARDPSSATAKGGPYGWDPLTYLCFSRYLKLDRTGSNGFVSAATALLAAGASANAGWWEQEHEPDPEWEPVLYGAAGIAHHAPLTRLLLAHGANPRDGEVVYHAPETSDNDALEALVESGKLTEDDLTLMLIRKHDWHDLAGARYLLEHGANPNRAWRHGLTAFHHALARCNGLPMFEVLLEHGADAALLSRGHSGAARAAREGRSDVLELLERRGVRADLAGVDCLIAACARGDTAMARELAAREPDQAREVLAMGGNLLARFAGACNAAGVRALLDLGVDAAAPFADGDGYYGEPQGSLAIHVAAWRACPEVVNVLLSRGAPADLPDPNGRTPLMLAIRACTESYWTERASTDSLRMLLEAGASLDRVALTTGHEAVDQALRKYRND